MSGAVGAADLVRMVSLMADTAIENEVAFCELDSAAGDGDFGMSLAKGFKELKAALPGLDAADLGAFLKACGLVVSEHCGGASGPIWGSAFRAAGVYAAGRTELDAGGLAGLLEAAAEGVMKRGKAQEGDKTLLDALIPAGRALRAAADRGAPLQAAMDEAAAAAVAGAEHTKDIVASRGRASYLGERSLSHPDAGAVAVGIIFTRIARETFPH